MMHVKKDIAEFLRLKDPAAKQLSADDLERIEQEILDKPEFELDILCESSYKISKSISKPANSI